MLSKPYKMEFSVICLGGLDRGFPASRANEFEQFFISKYKTMHDPVDRRNVCNQKPADHVSRLEEGWYERIAAELEAGFQWPELVPVEPLDAMGDDVLAARRQEAMLADLADKVPDVPQVEEEYSAAVTARKRVDPDLDSLVFAVDSPFARARELKEEYEEMAPHALVDRNVVAGQLTSIGQHWLDDKEADEEVASMIRLWQKSVHPNNEALVGKPITAGYAAALFSLAYQWCGEHEEALLLAQVGIDADTDEAPAHVNKQSSEAAIKHKDILQALQWRRWSEAHDGNAPKEKGYTAAVQSEEAKLAMAMRSWRNGNGGVARRRHSLYLLLLRHYKWFAPFVKGEKATGRSGLKAARDVNHYLRLGYGTQAEVDAGVADRTIPQCCNVCGSGNAVSQALRNFLAGANAKRADIILAPGGKLTEARVATLRAVHEGNIEEKTAATAATYAKQKAAREANGRSKKQKTETSLEEEGSDDED